MIIRFSFVYSVCFIVRNEEESESHLLEPLTMEMQNLEKELDRMQKEYEILNKEKEKAEMQVKVVQGKEESCRLKLKEAKQNHRIQLMLIKAAYEHNSKLEERVGTILGDFKAMEEKNNRLMAEIWKLEMKLETHESVNLSVNTAPSPNTKTSMMIKYDYL
jgi:TolA-binding protein